MSYPFYYPVVPSSYVPSSMSVDNNHEVGYKWYQSCPSSDVMAASPCLCGCQSSIPQTQIGGPNPYYTQQYEPPPVPPSYTYTTPHFATPTMSHSPTVSVNHFSPNIVQTEVAPKLFDEIPVRRTDSMVSEGATSVKGIQWEETLTKIITIIDNMQDDLTDRSTINDKMVQGKSIEVDEGTLPHHSEDNSTKLVSPLSQTDSSHNESAVSVELYDLSLVGTQNLESENDKIVYKLHENEVASGDGNYISDDGIKLLEMDGENSGIVIFLNKSEDMEKTGEEGINVENSAAFQSADSDSYFIEVDYKEGEVDYSPFDISLDLYKNYGNIDGEETMLIFDPGGGKIAASNFTTAVGILELLAVLSIIQAEVDDSNHHLLQLEFPVLKNALLTGGYARQKIMSDTSMVWEHIVKAGVGFNFVSWNGMLADFNQRGHAVKGMQHLVHHATHEDAWCGRDVKLIFDPGGCDDRLQGCVQGSYILEDKDILRGMVCNGPNKYYPNWTGLVIHLGRLTVLVYQPNPFLIIIFDYKYQRLENRRGIEEESFNYL